MSRARDLGIPFDGTTGRRNAITDVPEVQVGHTTLIAGHGTLLVDQDWPEADSELLVDDTVTVAVQVNGKLRATIELPVDAEDQAAQDQALAQPATRSLAALVGEPVPGTTAAVSSPAAAVS